LGLSPYGGGRPPIYVGAFASNAMMRLTGELADGWYPGAYYTPTTFGEKVKMIQEAAVGKGRRRDDLDLLVSLPVVFSDDAATMGKVKKAFRRELVKNRYMLKILGADEAYEYVSKSLQYQLIAPTPDYMRLLEKTTDSLPISDELLEKGIGEMTAVGPKDKCLESISRFVKAGATRIQMSAFLGDQETYEKFAMEVMSAVRAG
jgi:alkanesulfonate monooxygenase SsuD/methylene tetrahydromethanopterin reductase-like flavin-dependent oxidoreductase (luciferase family)